MNTDSYILLMILVANCAGLLIGFNLRDRLDKLIEQLGKKA
jgi:hypothetical protein